MGKSGKGNLMPWLIRASDEGMEVTHARNNTKEGSWPTHAYVRLSIYGNMFIFNTTAQTLTFTIHLLAAHPEVQDWMREELQ